MKLNEIADNRRRPQDAHAHRPRHRLGQGQDRRPRRQGPDRALGRAHQGLRRRPDAAASPPAKARLPQYQVRAKLNEINLGRVQAAIDAGKLDADAARSTPSFGQGRHSAPRQGRRAAFGRGRIEGEDRGRGLRRVEVGGGGGREGRRHGEDPRAPKPAKPRRSEPALKRRRAGASVPKRSRLSDLSAVWAALTVPQAASRRPRVVFRGPDRWCQQPNNWQPISILARFAKATSSRSASGSRSARCWSIGSAPTSRCPASIRSPGSRFSIARPAAFSACSTCSPAAAFTAWRSLR